jgi:hypothetical protein
MKAIRRRLPCTPIFAVRSFGTENRRPQGPFVPATDSVYPLLIFKGTDIKDLQVLQDPAVAQPTALVSLHFPYICNPAFV